MSLFVGLVLVSMRQVEAKLEKPVSFTSGKAAFECRKFIAFWSPAAPGFLGSHLCERLVEQGHDVICVDNFFTSQKTNVAHLLEQPNFDLVRHDITQPLVLDVDQIYNLACPAAPGHYQYNPDQDDEDVGARRDPHAGHRQALPREDSAGLDQRSVRRSRSASAAASRIAAR